MEHTVNEVAIGREASVINVVDVVARDHISTLVPLEAPVMTMTFPWMLDMALLLLEIRLATTAPAVSGQCASGPPRR